MANDISKLAVVVSANTSPLKSGLAVAAKDVDGFVGHLGGAGSRISGLLTNISGIGIAAIAGIGTALAAVAGIGAGLVGGIKLAAGFEQAQVALETMLGSADAAKTVLGDLKTFAAKTPFEFPELLESSKKLLAFGIETKNLMPSLKAIGDISAGVGVSVSDLSEIYGKARVQGTLMAEDINQLTGRGIPVIQEFAKQLGVSESQVKKLGSEGKITLANLQQAFVSLTSEGGRFEGFMEKQSATLGGLFSTLMDSGKMFLAQVGEKAVESLDLKGKVTEITTWMDENGPRLMEGLGAAFEAVKPLLDAGWEALKSIAGIVVDAVIPAFVAATPVIRTITTIIGGVITGIAKLAGGVAGAVRSVFEFVGVVKPAADKSQDLAGATSEAADSMGKLDAAGDLAKAKADQMATSVEGLTKKLQEQADTFGMSSNQVAIWKLAQQGATDEQLASVKALDLQLERLKENEKAMKDMASAAQKIKDDLLDPWEQLEEKLWEITRLERAGLLNAQQAELASDRASESLINSLAKKQPKQIKTPEPKNFFGEKTGALERRFTNGFTQDVTDPIQKLTKEAQKQTKAAQETAKNTKKLAEADREVVRM